MALTQLTNGMSGSDCRTNINASFTAVDALSYAPFNYGNTGAATVTLNAANGLSQKAAMTGDITLAAPSNPVAGMRLTVALLASGGARTITLGTITTPTGFTFTASVVSAKTRLIELYYSGTAWFLTSNLEF